MFSRLDHEVTPVMFPKEWSENVKTTLLSLYGDKCIKEDRTFEIFSFTYPTELLLIVSYTSLDKLVAPVTLFLSSDLQENNKDPKKMMDNLFDAVGVFFDSYFAGQRNEENEIWDEYIYEWQEADFGKQQIYYKVTRENIALSLEAESILLKSLN
jgi:hypothetical protein